LTPHRGTACPTRPACGLVGSAGNCSAYALTQFATACVLTPNTRLAAAKLLPTSMVFGVPSERNTFAYSKESVIHRRLRYLNVATLKVPGHTADVGLYDFCSSSRIELPDRRLALSAYTEPIPMSGAPQDQL
jgi:hypothetical protein